MLILSALLLGFLHGLGADHLMAIAALSIGPPGETATSLPLRRARALGVAVRFAIGHSLLLAVGAGALVALGWSLPIVVERTGELVGGTLLVLMGAAGLWGVAAGRATGHPHATGRGHALAHAHHVPTLVGAAFAVSSLRMLTTLAPFAAADGTVLSALQGSPAGGTAPLPLLLSLIAVFGVGILASMSLFGVAFARLISANAIARLGRGAALVMASASVTLGVFWIASA